MTDNKIQRVIESLTRDNEEKIYQMSHVRIVAETMVRGLHEPNYFTRVCNDFVKIFDAKITGSGSAIQPDGGLRLGQVKQMFIVLPKESSPKKKKAFSSGSGSTINHSLPMLMIHSR
ncbi:hypothetical protein ACFLQV_04845 [Calditrichota bacterium]